MIGNGANVEANKDLKVEAKDEYKQVNVVITIAGSGTAAVGIAAQVDVAFNTVTAGIGNYATAVARHGNVNVQANSDRLVDAVAVNLAVSGMVGVGVTLTATVAGGKLDKDASDSLYSKEDGKGFNPEKLLAIIREKIHGSAKNDMSASSLDTGMLKNEDDQTMSGRMGTYGGYGQSAGTREVKYVGVLDATGETEIFNVYVKNKDTKNEERLYELKGSYYDVNREGKLEKISTLPSGFSQMYNEQSKITIDGQEYLLYLGRNGEQVYEKDDVLYLVSDQDDEYEDGEKTRPETVKVTEECPVFFTEEGKNVYLKAGKYYKAEDNTAYTGTVYTSAPIRTKVYREYPLYLDGETELYRKDGRFYRLDNNAAYSGGTPTAAGSSVKLLDGEYTKYVGADGEDLYRKGTSYYRLSDHTQYSGSASILCQYSLKVYSDDGAYDGFFLNVASWGCVLY